MILKHRTFRAQPFLIKEVEMTAKKLNLSFSEIVRAALSEFLIKNNTKESISNTNRSLKSR